MPYTAGSGFDVTARLAGQKLSEHWGQPVIVDNKPGASGTLGTEVVASAAPDGYTLLVSGGPHTVYSGLMKNLRFDPINDFTPLGVLRRQHGRARGESRGAAGQDRPRADRRSQGEAGLLQLLIARRRHAAAARHGAVRAGAWPQGAAHPLSRGRAGAITDLINGQVQFTYLPVNSALPQVQAGKLRMLAVASTKRWPLAPDVPTLGEVGYPSLDFDLWFGFMGPKGLPPAIVQKWNDELAQIGAMADVKDGPVQAGAGRRRS